MPSTPKVFTSKQLVQAKPVIKVRTYDRNRGSARKRGYDAAWEKLRKWYLRQPENVFCACGCGGISEQVDHIDAIDGKEDPKRLDIRNLQALTDSCHKQKTNRFDGGYGRKPDESQEGKALLAAMRAKAEERAAMIEARGL